MVVEVTWGRERGGLQEGVRGEEVEDLADLGGLVGEGVVPYRLAVAVGVPGQEVRECLRSSVSACN